MNTFKVKKLFFGAGLVIGCIGIAFILVTFSNVNNIVPVVEHKSFKSIMLDWVGEGDPGAGNSGVMNVYIYPHNTTGATPYDKNQTEGTAYAYGSTNNTHIGSNVPYTTAFDIVVKVRWNTTHATSDGSTWQTTYTRAYCNCSGLSISAAAMTQRVIGSDSSYEWVNYYLNNTNGYTITKGQNITSCSFNFEAYY